MGRFILIFLLFTAELTLGQIGYPGGGYPGGGYPPGQYPGQTGGGIPFPWPRRRGQTRTEKNPGNKESLSSYSGSLRSLTDKSIIVQAADGRTLNFERSTKTRFMKDGDEIAASRFKPGDEVSVDATEDKNGYLHAMNVRLDKAGEPRAAQSGESETQMAPPPAPPDPGDPGPPTLKRGKPARREAPEDQDSTTTTTVAADASHTATSADPVIEKARSAALALTQKLPDYRCKEQMARFASEGRPASWKPLDVVTTDVIYEDGREHYANIAINGKPANKEMEQLNGSWSTGEFGTILIDLFSPGTHADFHLARQSTAAGVSAKVYDFTVERPNSHWYVQVASQSVKPAYTGSVWIDPSNGHVLRIEMQAAALPHEFPLVAVESAVDYEYVRIGTGQYLLPVHAENLSCERGSTACSRNVIDFRNYQKYNADSSITFGGVQ